VSDNIALSIDLETLKARYDAAILSIGAAFINLDTGKLQETFYREITFNSAIKGGKIDGDTLSWWCQQDAKARRVFGDQAKKVTLSTALDQLNNFFRLHPGATVWGNGSSFDITILEHNYDHGCVGLKEPWAYWKVRDMRTIVDVAGLTKPETMMVAGSVAHNALDDAIHQAMVISKAWRKVRTAMGVLKAQAEVNTKPVKPAPDQHHGPDDEL
jgi:hypothetical protein